MTRRKISPVDANKVYKLVNELSHNSDQHSIIEHKRQKRMQSNKILLNIVENQTQNILKF